MQSSNKLSTNCYHCGENCNNNKIRLEDKVFCCDGCKLVYEILNENDLCTYYDLNDNPGLTQKIKVRENKFSFLDDNQIQQKLIQFTDGKQTHITFYLPQMHCSSCLWLIENLHKINKGVVASTVNFTKKEVFIIYQNDLTTLRKVVEFTAIGYEPHISLQDVEEQKIQFSENLKLYKLE
ncbi:MAG: heavy metal translocating P-type ATPase metal-binding domain-containing protein [Chitinophagales bacterium]